MDIYFSTRFNDRVRIIDKDLWHYCSKDRHYSISKRTREGHICGHCGQNFPSIKKIRTIMELLILSGSCHRKVDWEGDLVYDMDWLKIGEHWSL